MRIDIEGTDGAGKTTGLKYLIDLLQQEHKKSVLETREVGNPHIPICVELRKTILNPDSNLSGEAMELIFSAMRLENDRFYKKVGELNDFIVSDRGWLSHLAYTDHNVSPEFTEKLYFKFLENETSLPDVVVYFDVDEQTALARRTRRGEEADVIELKGVPFQQKVRRSFEDYLEMYDTMGEIKVIRVDANQDLENVKGQLAAIARQLVDMKEELQWKK